MEKTFAMRALHYILICLLSLAVMACSEQPKPLTYIPQLDMQSTINNNWFLTPVYYQQNKYSAIEVTAENVPLVRIFEQSQSATQIQNVKQLESVLKLNGTQIVHYDTVPCGFGVWCKDKAGNTEFPVYILVNGNKSWRVEPVLPFDVKYKAQLVDFLKNMKLGKPDNK